MGKAEAYVEDYLVHESEKHGFKCYKWVSPGVRGVPDRIFMGNGRIVFIETKSPVGTTRKQQDFRIKEMRQQGADVRVIHTREAVDQFLYEITTKSTP